MKPQKSAGTIRKPMFFLQFICYNDINGKPMENLKQERERSD